MRNAIFGDQACNVHAQVAKGSEAYQAVDGLMERLQKEEGGQDEQDAEDGQDGDDTFGDGEGINLCLSERHAFRVRFVGFVDDSGFLEQLLAMKSCETTATAGSKRSNGEGGEVRAEDEGSSPQHPRQKMR